MSHRGNKEKEEIFVTRHTDYSCAIIQIEQRYKGRHNGYELDRSDRELIQVDKSNVYKMVWVARVRVVGVKEGMPWIR